MAHDPRLLALAIDAVLEAGRIQLQYFGGPMRVDKKGEIDLVTEVDIAVERQFRARMAEQFPDHQVLGEELQEDEAQRRPVPGHCWVFDPVDGTTNFAHGLPIFCASLGLEIDGAVLLHHPIAEHLVLSGGVEGGILIPGSAFEDAMGEGLGPIGLARLRVGLRYR